MLVYLYYHLSYLSRAERKIEIEKLSLLLRNRAIFLRFNVEKYNGNQNEITKHYIYIDTYGKRGLSSFSKIDEEMILMYKERINEFNKILIEARDRDNMDNKSTFLKWLIDVEKNKIPNDILDTLIEIDEYTFKTKKVVYSLWNIVEVKEWNRFVNKLNADKYFIIKNKLKNNHYTFGLNCYLNFLNRYSLESIQLVDQKIEIDTISEKIVSDRKASHNSFDITTDIVKVIRCNNNCDNFYNWMLQIKQMPTLFANNYFSAVKKSGEYAIQEGITSNTFLEMEDPEQIKKAIIELQVNKEFIKNNDIQHNRLSAALKKFYEFAVRNSETFILLDDFKPLIKKDSIDYQEYEKVLLEKFPRGFKKGSSIDEKKFRRFYEEKYGKVLLVDKDGIQKIITKIGIEYDDSRIMSPQNAIDEERLSTIFDYIESNFNSGKMMIYYQSIFEQFHEELITTNVYNDKILKQVLMYFSKSKYYFKRTFITNNFNTEADPTAEIKQILVSNVLPMSYEEIEMEIHHIPLVKLKSVMARKPEFVNTERNYYTHIECIFIDEADIQEISTIIEELIAKNGFATREDIIKTLKANNLHIIEKNSMITELGLGNAIEYYCNDNYDCNGTIFSSKGTKLSIGKIFVNYCIYKDIVKLSELELLAKDLGFTSLHGFYLAEVFSDFSRINQEMFVRKSNLKFESNTIDSILDKFCISDYIAFSEITTFALFPSNEYPWNSFLLESYVKDYSIIYKCLSDSISMNKCVGAIVKKNSIFVSYKQVLIEVLVDAKENCLSDKKVALNYLYKNGFIAKRRMSNIDDLIASAKIIKEQRGKV